jgi:CrcB protein
LGELLLVGTGGAIGCCARYLAARVSVGLMPQFPLGTLFVNCAAALAAGILLGLTGGSAGLVERLRLPLGVGFLGGLSTHSAFSAETFTLLQEGRYVAAAGNVALNTFLPLALVALGWWLAAVTARCES